MVSLVGEFVPEVSLQGLLILSIGAFISGLVRGFSGFGTAMVYLPFAGSQLSPVWALTSMVIMDLTAPLTLVPKTFKDSYLPDIYKLGLGALITCPLGVLILVLLEPEIFRYSVSILTFVLLILLVIGFRYRGKLTAPLIIGTGGLGGFLSGTVGLPGPPVIMLYMASTLPVKTIRANIFIYLIFADLLLLGIFGFKDLLDLSAVFIGVIVMFPYLTALWIGSYFFDSEKEKQYRNTAYLIIFFSALIGLPIWY